MLLHRVAELFALQRVIAQHIFVTDDFLLSIDHGFAANKGQAQGRGWRQRRLDYLFGFACFVGIVGVLHLLVGGIGENGIAIRLSRIVLDQPT